MDLKTARAMVEVLERAEQIAKYARECRSREKDRDAHQLARTAAVMAESYEKLAEDLRILAVNAS